MKTRTGFTGLAALVLTAALSATPVAARAADDDGGDPRLGVQDLEAAAAPTPKTKHQRLCATLGLTVNGRYEFRLSPEKVFYYEVKSLGSNGWVLMKGFQFPDRWVNLSQVIAITPIPVFANDPRMLRQD